MGSGNRWTRFAKSKCSNRCGKPGRPPGGFGMNDRTLPRTFHARNVLVTGHTGFKGAWLATWLKRMGANVVGLGRRPDSQPSLFEAAQVGRGLVSVIGDV